MYLMQLSASFSVRFVTFACANFENKLCFQKVVPPTIFDRQFLFLIGYHPVAETGYLIKKKEIKMTKTQIVLNLPY